MVYAISGNLGSSNCQHVKKKLPESFGRWRYYQFGPRLTVSTGTPTNAPLRPATCSQQLGLFGRSACLTSRKICLRQSTEMRYLFCFCSSQLHRFYVYLQSFCERTYTPATRLPDFFNTVSSVSYVLALLPRPITQLIGIPLNLSIVLSKITTLLFKLKIMQRRRNEHKLHEIVEVAADTSSWPSIER